MMGARAQEIPKWALVRCPDCGERFILHQHWPRFRGRIVSYDGEIPGGPEGFMGIEWLDECPDDRACEALVVEAVHVVEKSRSQDDRVETCAGTNAAH